MLCPIYFTALTLFTSFHGCHHNLILDNKIHTNKRKKFGISDWIITQEARLPLGFYEVLGVPDYGVGVGDMPVMLSPPMPVMLSPVMFWATAGVAIETGPTTAAMPNAATIATAASMIFVFIAIEGNAIHYIRIYDNNDPRILLSTYMFYIESK
jgi:hypothetical protein